MVDLELDKKFLFYDGVGAFLILVSLYFFIRAVQLAGKENFVAGILGALIGSLIFSAGIGLIKISAAAKATKKAE